MSSNPTTAGIALALPLAALLFAAPARSAQEDAAGTTDEDEAFLSGSGEGQGAAPAADAAPEGGEAGQPVAEAAPAGEGADAGKWGGKLRDHRHQGFVNVLAGTGWYLVAPYDKNDPEKACSELKDSNNVNTPEGEGDPVCSGRSPFHLDFLAGWGVTDGIELFAMFRLGVEPPPERVPETRLIGAGIKIYSPSDGLFKIAFGVAPLFDFSERRVSDAYDFVIHVPIAAHFDFLPWFGTYLQVAPNISFVTEFKMDITAGLGVQGRFP